MSQTQTGLPQFGDRLVAAVRDKRSHVVLGLDPHLDILNRRLPERVFTDRGRTADEIARVMLAAVDAAADLVAAVKINVAFFERLGPAGLAGYEGLVEAAAGRGVLVISDAKRGDIGSTAEAYAAYHLGPATDPAGGATGALVSWFRGADAMTVSPYLGADSLAPFTARIAAGRGLFVLVRTSNPGSAALQEATVTSGAGPVPLFVRVAESLDGLDGDPAGAHGYRAVGFVVGLTQEDAARRLRAPFRQHYFLVPGYGAQGGSAAAAAPFFNDDGLGAVVAASRSLLFTSDDEPGAKSWQAAVRAATEAMRDDVNAALSNAGKLAW